MFFHVYTFVYFDEINRRGNNDVFLNLTEEQLRERFVDRWDQGEPMTWSGRTVDSAKIASISVYRTEDQLPENAQYAELSAAGEDVTNDWIVGPAGHRQVSQTTQTGAAAESLLRDHRRVMVVHGRNRRARDAMFLFLRAIGLEPIEWDDAIAETGAGSPHNLEAVRAAMEVGQAVVVVLTAEDQAGLIPDLADGPDDDDTTLRGQPRQNVILEAGLAMGIDPARVILVELGSIRRASDFDGLNAVRLANAAPTRLSLRSRLQTAGCAVAERGSDWTRPEAGGDFDGAVIHI
jgi:predicted nucleotide-binding protein